MDQGKKEFPIIVVFEPCKQHFFLHCLRIVKSRP